MKVKFGSIVVAGAGKLGGHDFVRSRYGSAVLRTKPGFFKKSTSLQSLSKSRMLLVRNSYSALTSDQIESWNSFSKTVQYANIFGDILNLSGQQLYCQLNINRLILSLSQISEPPLINSFETIQLDYVYVDIPSNRLLLLISDYITISTSLKIFATKPQSTGVTSPGRHFKLIGTYSNTTTRCFDISSMYVQTYGRLPSSSEQVFFKLSTVDTESGFERYSNICSSVYPTCLVILTNQSSIQQVTIRARILVGGSLTVDWGNGSSSFFAGDGNYHDFISSYTKTSAFYKIKITGSFSFVDYFRMINMSYCYFDVSQFVLMSNLKYLYCYTVNCSGNVSSLNSLTQLLSLRLYESQICGDISLLSSLTSLITVYLHNTNIFGNINFLLQLSSITHIYMYVTSIDFCGVLTSVPDNIYININSCTLNSSIIDDILIQLDVSGAVSGNLLAAGNNEARTSASDSAYSSLISKSWSLSIN